MKDLSVGKQLSLCFGLLFLVVLILGTFWQRGIVAVKEIEGKKAHLIELKEKLREMQLIHYKWVDNLRNVVRERGTFTGELDATKCPFGTWYYTYELPYPELTDVYKALEKPHNNFHESGALVVKAMEEGDFAKADTISLHTRQVLLPELMDVYSQFMKGIGDAYDTYKLESEQSIKWQTMVSAVIVGLSLLSVIILVIVRTRGIVKPLKRVTNTAQRIAEGDIPVIPETGLPTESKNEIVQLHIAFNKMATSLNDLSRTAEKIAGGDLTAQVRIRSGRDVLAKSISQMVDNLKQSLEELHTNSMNLALGMSDYFTVISELAQGNLDIRASEKTGDDLLDQLGKITNNMIYEYRRLADCVVEIKKGNLEVTVPIRSDKDSLGIGFEHMRKYLQKTMKELHTISMNLAMGLTDYFFILQKVAEGDLTVHASEDTGDDLLNQLGKVTNAMILSLKDMTLKILEQANFLGNSSTQMALVASQSTRALSELSSATARASSSTSSVADGSKTVFTAAQEARATTQVGIELMLKLLEKTKAIQAAAETSVGAMRSLSTYSLQIGTIVNVMTKIAAQTNLLSLNASIVAAQAGEMGHGFSVVADEVHSLSESSASSTQEIDRIIKEVQEEISRTMISVQKGDEEIEDGRQVIETTSHQFAEIASRVENIVNQMEKISRSAEETAASAEEASASSREQSSAMEEFAAAAAELSIAADILKNTMSMFKV